MSDKLQVAIGLVLLVLALLFFAALGVIGFGVTAIVISGGLYLLGFISQGTAQAIALWIGAIGALWGMFVGAGTAAGMAS